MENITELKKKISKSKNISWMKRDIILAYIEDVERIIKSAITRTEGVCASCDRNCSHIYPSELKIELWGEK